MSEPASANCVRADPTSLPISRPDSAAAAPSGFMSSSSVEARMRNRCETASPGCASPSSSHSPKTGSSGDTFESVAPSAWRRIECADSTENNSPVSHVWNPATAPFVDPDPLAVRAGHADQQVGAVQAGDAGKLGFLAAHHVRALAARAARRPERCARRGACPAPRSRRRECRRTAPGSPRRAPRSSPGESPPCRTS